MRLDIKRRWAAITLGAVVVVAGAFLFLDAVFPFPEAELRPEPAVRVWDEDGVLLRVFLPQDGRLRFRTALDEISPELRQSFIASEDRWFYYHPGVNPFSVIRAAFTNLKHGRVVCGASTIPMQIARMVEPKERTLRSKLIESFRALQLTLHHDKDELFEIYLNLLPFGGNIQGVSAAAYRYFNTTAARLTPAEAAMLTAVPKSPRSYDPVRRAKAARQARNEVLNRLEEEGVYTSEVAAAAKEKPLPSALKPLPFIAPHFCRFAHELHPHDSECRTTLQREIQAVVVSLARSRMRELRRQDIDNCAVVVVDNESRAVRAMLGSESYFDTEHQGGINCAVIQRSPGSALKPFLYGLALDTGRVVPESMLLDVPTDYSGYAPENYDGKFNGRVTVQEALTRSLNVPAVRLLADIGVERFHSLLCKLGCPPDKTAGEYGLPLVLGAAETTLLDLTGAYATLAGGGVYHPVKVFAGEKTGPGSQVYSRAAAQMLTEMLTETRRPNMEEAWDLTRDMPAVAWKTGTSYGHRDAWAVGFTKRYSIGVWVGNPDGRSVKGISGAKQAAPLLFDVFRAVDPGGKPPAFDVLFEELELCALSGKRPGRFCPQRMSVRAVPGASRPELCRVHRSIFVDAETGLRLEGECPGTKYKQVTAVVDPPELAAWERSLGLDVGLPTIHPACGGLAAEPGPRIVSPDPHTVYTRRHGVPKEYQRIPLSVRVESDVGLHWFQDGRPAGSGGTQEQLFIDPIPGKHRLVVVDEFGRMDAVNYTVE